MPPLAEYGSREASKPLSRPLGMGRLESVKRPRWARGWVRYFMHGTQLGLPDICGI